MLDFNVSAINFWWDVYKINSPGVRQEIEKPWRRFLHETRWKVVGVWDRAVELEEVTGEQMSIVCKR